MADFAQIEVLQLGGLLLVSAALVAALFSTHRELVLWFIGGMVYWVGIECLSYSLQGFGVQPGTAYLSAIGASLAGFVTWLALTEPKKEQVFMEHTPLTQGDVPTSSRR